MEFLTPNEFRKMVIVSYEKIKREKEQINKINVFPVPDQDTGDNLAKTLEGIKKEIEGREFSDFNEISKAMLVGALNSSQGNAGVIYTGFLAGFLQNIKKNPVDIQSLTIAFRKGAERARKSIQEPKEGTILDVIDAATLVFQEEADRRKDIIELFKLAISKAKEALLATREKMEIFRKANVVDAGGLGFLMILEGYLEALEPPSLKTSIGEEKPSERVKRFIQILSNRYEIVCLLKNPRFEEKIVFEKLRRLGNSTDIVKVGKKMKIHIHTDYPDEVKDVIRQTGEILILREEDMTKEVAGQPSLKKISIGIVTEDIAGLTTKILERYQIKTVRTRVEWPEAEKIPGQNIYQKMREAQRKEIKSFPRAEQASPKFYLDSFLEQLQKFDKVLCLTVSSKISGCYHSAYQAKETLGEEERKRIFILDSLQGAAGESLLVLAAIEMIQEQREIGEILQKLKIMIPKIYLYGIFENPVWIEAGGRLTKLEADWIRRIRKINLHPLITIKEGRLTRGGVVFAKDAAEAIFKKIARKSRKARKQGKRIRVIINHTDNREGAEKLKNLLKRIKAEIPFISLVSPAIASQTGPGTLIAAWTALEY